MKYPCNLIRDILPLYYDGVVSKESEQAVEEHFGECEDCKSYYKKMCETDILEVVSFDEEITKKMADSYKEVAKTISKRVIKTILKYIVIIVVVMIGVVFGLWIWVASFLEKSAEDTWETHYDVSEYGMLDDGRNLLEFSQNLSDVWPKEITENMNVTDYLLIHYCPWDSNYLGYLEVEYDAEDYQVEVERLSTYESTEYLGNYGAGIFKEKELLAMYADSHNFIYALADSERRINYVYLAFPSYSMDIDYEEYIPKDCLPKGLDLSEDNPVIQEILKEREKELEGHKEQIRKVNEGS